VLNSAEREVKNR